MRNPTKVPFSEFSVFPFRLARVSIKVWAFLAVLALVHLFIGYKLGGRVGLWAGFAFATLLVVLVYFFAETPLLHKFRAQKLKGQDAWNLRELAQKYSRLAGVPVPDLYLMDHSTPVAFSMGPSWNQATVCLSTSLLQKMSDKEIEAIMAHQICHLRRIETFSFSVSSALANSFIGLAAMLDRAWPFNWSNKGIKYQPFLTLLSPISGLIIRIAMSDRSYFEIDDMAASFVSDSKTLAQALWKLESYCQTLPIDILPCTNHLFIVNPEGFKESNWFYVTHPKMESRLRRLVGTYPL